MIPKKNRVSRVSFGRLHGSVRVSGTLCSLSLFLLTKGESTQVACVVSRVVSKSAVERNRVKRRFRDVLRAYIHHKNPVAIILFAKRAAIRAPRTSIEKEVAFLIEGAFRRTCKTR